MGSRAHMCAFTERQMAKFQSHNDFWVLVYCKGAPPQCEARVDPCNPLREVALGLDMLVSTVGSWWA